MIAALDAPASEKVAVQLQLTLLQLGPDVNLQPDCPYWVTAALLSKFTYFRSTTYFLLALPQSLRSRFNPLGMKQCKRQQKMPCFKLLPRVPSPQEVESILYRQAQALLKGEKRLQKMQMA
ncbi:MAG: hypothetical protein U0894_02840 [Pirellulales bacterium]